MGLCAIVVYVTTTLMATVIGLAFVFIIKPSHFSRENLSSSFSLMGADLEFFEATIDSNISLENQSNLSKQLSTT